MVSKEVEGDIAKNENVVSSNSDASMDEVARFSTNFGPIRRNHNRNKTIEFKICFRFMWNDNFKRHMAQHWDLYLMDGEEAHQEIRSQRQVYMEKEKQQLKLDLISHDMEVPRGVSKKMRNSMV